MNVAILGAGDIGCATGIALAADGAEVTFIGRASQTNEALVQAAIRGGARLQHGKGWSVGLSAEQCAASFTTDLTRLASADIILLACKRHHNTTVVPSIACHAKASALVVALQNGVCVADELRSLLGDAGPTASHAVVKYATAHGTRDQRVTLSLLAVRAPCSLC